jgi:hypothetical protein
MQRYAAGKFVSKSLTTGVSRCRQISRIAGQIVNRIYNLYPNFTTSGITFYSAFCNFLFYISL